MKNKWIAVTVVIAVVIAAAVGIGIAAHRSAVKREAAKPAAQEAEQDGTPEIVIMSDKERIEFIKKLAKDSDFLASYPGASGENTGGDGTDSGMKYANSSRPLPLSKDIALYTIYKARENGLDPDLIFCIIWRESNFNPNEIGRNSNGTYDYGLMQINSSNFSFLSQKVGITSMDDLLDPYKNIDCGIYYIASYMRKYGDMNKALMCYNLGEAGAQNKWKQGIYYSSYSKSIIERMGQYYLVENYTMPRYYSQGGAVYYNDDGEEVPDENTEETETATVIETTTKAKKKEYVPHEKEYQKDERKTTEAQSVTEKQTTKQK